VKKNWSRQVQFREHQLANGLQLIAECNPAAYSTSLGFFVNAGSRDETDANSGVSHFLEHMMFKGTPTRSAWDVNRQLDEMGSRSNAMTNQERTVYYGTVLPEFQTPMTELLCDIMRPALRTEDFEIEKEVIIEEIQTSEDQPPYGGYERLMAMYFGDHPLSRSVLGTVDSITDLSVDQMRAYFAQRYSPSNVTLVASGQVDFDQLIATAEKACGHWEEFEGKRETPLARGRGGCDVLVKEQSTQEYVMQLLDAPAAKDDDRIAARVLTTILGDDSGSRLYWDLVETGLVEYVDVSCYEYQGTGVYATFFCCAPDQAEANMARLQKVLDSAKQGVSDDELIQAKNKICSHVVLSSERPISRLFSLGVNWLQRDQYRTVRETADAYDAVTLSDLKAVAEKYPFENATTLAVGPLTKFSIT